MQSREQLVRTPNGVTRLLRWQTFSAVAMFKRKYLLFRHLSVYMTGPDPRTGARITGPMLRLAADTLSYGYAISASIDPICGHRPASSLVRVRPPPMPMTPIIAAPVIAMSVIHRKFDILSFRSPRTSHERQSNRQKRRQNHVSHAHSSIWRRQVEPALCRVRIENAVEPWEFRIEPLFKSSGTCTYRISPGRWRCPPGPRLKKAPHVFLVRHRAVAGPPKFARKKADLQDCE